MDNLLFLCCGAEKAAFIMQLAKPYPKGGGAKPPKPSKPKGGKGGGKEQRNALYAPVMILMALVKFAGTGAIGISGKIAGTVFNIGGQQGAFVRVLAIPRNRRTSFQVLARGVLSGIASSFRTLTGSQVDAWNAAAADDSPNSIRRNVFGDIRKLSGSQMFQRLNNIVTSIGA
ncbi:MAG TPA: hypothetical protein VK892_20215, partial [Pyrinomonadaceae bacterium]|nr:hypothetical protein [Pyrinomonadaceae bacterium]